jgi:hypothetical protein
MGIVRAVAAVRDDPEIGVNIAVGTKGGGPPKKKHLNLHHTPWAFTLFSASFWVHEAEDCMVSSQLC